MHRFYKEPFQKSPPGLSARWPERLRGPRPINMQKQNCSGCSNFTLAQTPRTQSFLIFYHFFIKEKVKDIFNILIINFIKIDVIIMKFRRQDVGTTEKFSSSFLIHY